MITFHVVTLFPESFSYLNESMLARAQKNKKIRMKFYNPRDFTKDKHRTADERPYSGGPGMVLKAEPILKAVEKARGKKKKIKTIILSPRGKQFTHAYARKLSQQNHDVVLIAGHYEGIDERVQKILKAEKISIGPYVLTGGELPAMAVVDAASRYVKGVLGKHNSLEEKRLASSEVYTRPGILHYKNKTYRVPKVLLSGDHKKIEEWRKRHH